MPPNFVNVMPERTDEPISAKASRARATRPCCGLNQMLDPDQEENTRTRMSSNLLANARAIWAQNSTAIPVAMTRLTNETAFSEMSHTTMIPIRFKIINDIVSATQNPAASPFTGLKKPLTLNFIHFTRLRINSKLASWFL